LRNCPDTRSSAIRIGEKIQAAVFAVDLVLIRQLGGIPILNKSLVRRIAQTSPARQFVEKSTTAGCGGDFWSSCRRGYKRVLFIRQQPILLRLDKIRKNPLLVMFSCSRRTAQQLHRMAANVAALDDRPLELMLDRQRLLLIVRACADSDSSAWKYTAAFSAYCWRSWWALERQEPELSHMTRCTLNQSSAETPANRVTVVNPSATSTPDRPRNESSTARTDVFHRRHIPGQAHVGRKLFRSL